MKAAQKSALQLAKSMPDAGPLIRNPSVLLFGGVFLVGGYVLIRRRRKWWKYCEELGNQHQLELKRADGLLADSEKKRREVDAELTQLKKTLKDEQKKAVEASTQLEGKLNTCSTNVKDRQSQLDKALEAEQKVLKAYNALKAEHDDMSKALKTELDAATKNVALLTLQLREAEDRAATAEQQLADAAQARSVSQLKQMALEEKKE